jgi:hypothetical protein
VGAAPDAARSALASGRLGGCHRSGLWPDAGRLRQAGFEQLNGHRAAVAGPDDVEAALAHVHQIGRIVLKHHPPPDQALQRAGGGIATGRAERRGPDAQDAGVDAPAVNGDLEGVSGHDPREAGRLKRLRARPRGSPWQGGLIERVDASERCEYQQQSTHDRDGSCASGGTGERTTAWAQR